MEEIKMEVQSPTLEATDSVKFHTVDFQQRHQGTAYLLDNHD